MQTIEGYVEAIIPKQTSTGKTMYNMRVAGQSFGVGMYPPRCKEGDYVTFTMTMNGNFKNVERNTLSVKAGMPPAPAVAPAPTGGKNPMFSDDRQEVISKQAALNSAIATVAILANTEALPGITKTAKAGDKMAVVQAAIDEFTCQYYEQSTGKKLTLTRRDVSDSGSMGEEATPDSWE